MLGLSDEAGTVVQPEMAVIVAGLVEGQVSGCELTLSDLRPF